MAYNLKMFSNEELVKNIEAKSISYLDSKKRGKRVLEALRSTDRINFLPESVKRLAYEDIPLSIGYGQTCSQPSMVAFMLDKLSIQAGNSVLEIGAGCGYAAAAASILCAPGGTVYASELKPELADLARANLAGYENVSVISADGSEGFPEYAPFDRIFLSAGVPTKNFKEEILLAQLKEEGILLYPENFGNIFLLKKEDRKIIRETFYGVSFVSLKGKNA
jgi:protein-L-isoaspartate(D-aspartate) O-methyltransferase